MAGADGPGPEYCELCRWKRKSAERCAQCLEPALLPENAEAVALFRRLASQWRYSPSGRLVGLEYSAAETLMRLETVRDPRDCFARLQVLEAAVIAVARAKAERPAIGAPRSRSSWPPRT